MRPPFKDATAVPIPGLPLVSICPRAGVINPMAYNVIEMDKSLVGEGIGEGDLAYVVSTVDIESGDLVAVNTPDGVFVRFLEWFADTTGAIKARLISANPEVAMLVYDYDDEVVRTRWRVVWVCRRGSHIRCSAFKRQGRVIC